MSLNTIGLTSWAFAIGAMGQWAIYARVFPRFPDWLLMAALFVPWLTVFVISFCNRPPFGPRPFRRCLIFAMGWYLVATLLAEALHFFIQPTPKGHFSLVAARSLMYVFGAVSFVVFLRACNFLRRCEAELDAKRGSVTNDRDCNS